MRGTCFFAAFALLTAGAACGAAREAGSDAAEVGETSTVARYGGPWGVDIEEPSRASGEPTLVEQLAVFRAKRTARDMFDTFIPSDARPDTAEGRELLANSRRLADAGDMRLFGVPTGNGWVCPRFVHPDGEEGEGGPCWSTLREGVSFSLEGDSLYYRLYGVAADDVESVTVVADGRSVPASMGRNSFVFGAKTIAICPTDLDRLMIRRSGGKSSVIELSAVSPLRGTTSERAVLGCL